MFSEVLNQEALTEVLETFDPEITSSLWAIPEQTRVSQEAVREALKIR